MLNRRRMLMGGTAVAVAAAISSIPLTAAAESTTPRSVAPAGDDVVVWLKANALPLATAEPGSGFQDLAPFRRIIGDARIVSLGEATHGTRDFFQLKHRLMEYCVSELGFTVIGFEAEYGTTLAVNDYVLNGKSNALDATTGMGFWTWDTEEVVALVEWVRAWNIAHERKVKFYGFDMQGSAASALHLLAYLERVAPKLAAAAERDLAPLVSYGTLNEFRKLPEDVQDMTFRRIKRVFDAFDDRRENWIDETSKAEWNLARQSALVIRQFAHSKRVDEDEDWTKGFSFRDRSMAANVRSLLDVEGRGTRAVLWAHNGHIQQSSTWEMPAAGRFEMGNMGSFLQEEFGDDYVAVGFAFNQGAFQAMGVKDGVYGLRDHAVGPAPAGSVDATLAATGIPLFAVDLARVPDRGPVARWMASRPSQRFIGAVFAADEAQYVMVADPRDNYDVLLFVENTTAAHGNKRPDLGTRPVGSDRNDEPTNLALTAGDAVPNGWRAIHHSLYPYAMAAADGASNGGRSIRMARAGSPLWWGDGELTQSFPAAPWHGRRLVFGAAMRAEAPRIGTGAQIVVHVWPKQKEGESWASYKPIRTVRSEGMVRSSDWTRQSVAVDVPAEAERIQISLLVTGDSAGSFGDLKLGTQDLVHSVGMRPVARRHHVPVRPVVFQGRLDG